MKTIAQNKIRYLLLLLVCLMLCPTFSGCSLFGGDEENHSAGKRRDDDEDEEDSDPGEEEAWMSTYVYGFSAGGDPVLLLYEVNGKEMAFLKSGSREVFEECVVENASLEDGTEYVLVSAGDLSLGYYEEEGEIYLLDDTGKATKAEEVAGEDTAELTGELGPEVKKEKKDSKEKEEDEEQEAREEKNDNGEKGEKNR